MRSHKYIVLSNLSIIYSWENLKKSRKKNKFKISPSMWNENFELSERLYSLSDI